MIFHLAARLFANYSAEMNETWWRKQQWGGQVSRVMLGCGCTSYLSPKKAFILILMSVSHSARKSKIPSLKIFVYFNTCKRTHVGVVLIANTLHKEVKSQKVMAEKVDCSASAASKHSNGKLNVVGKRAQTRGVTAVTKVNSRTWERVTTSGLTVVQFIESHHALVSSRDKSLIAVPLLNKRQHQKWVK